MVHLACRGNRSSCQRVYDAEPSGVRGTLAQGVMVHSGSTTPTRQANGEASSHTAALQVVHALHPKESDIDMAIRVRVGAWFMVLESVCIQRVQDFFANARASVLELAHLDEVTQQQLQVARRRPTRILHASPLGDGGLCLFTDCSACSGRVYGVEPPVQKPPSRLLTQGKWEAVCTLQQRDSPRS